MSDSALLFDSRRAYDPVGNVANVWTTLPTGTDYQAFCYDEQNRLTWASSTSGSVPCGGSWTAGSLSSAGYTNMYAYDTLDRLTSGPVGSYTFGDAQHLGAVTGIGSTYTAAYDAAGNMTCRAPTNSATCTGTLTGAQLTYDNEGRLSAWQNAPGGSPSSSTQGLYDGEGHHVEQFISSGATTTSTTYVTNIEEVSTSGGITSTTTSYYAAGKRVAQAVNGAFVYLGSDGLGSAEVALDASGNAQGSVLFGPYGSGRYSNGTMPGSYGYTGQRADAATGLDYYNARYYDAVAWQFASADSMQDGLNRYAYVGGNPETASDPTGHISVCDHCDVDLDPPPNPSPQPAPTPGPSKGQQPPSNKTSGASTTTTITSLCDEKCRDDRSAGMGDFWKGLGGSVGLLALMAGSCAFGPACAGVMHVLLPMLLQTLHIMLDGLDLLDRAAGGSVGDWLSLFVRGAKVAIDVLQVIIGISDVFDIFEKVTSAWKGFKALGSFLRDVFSQESSALAKDAGTTAAALLGFSNDITQDLTDLNESVEAFALAHGAAA